MSRARRDDPGMAASLELAALTALDPDEALALVDEAAGIWAGSTAPYGHARNRLVFARIAGGDAGRDAAIEAERIFRAMGARGPAADAAEIVEAITTAERATLRIQSLGRFRLVRDGLPVPTTAWQSKKARDLLKILVARRGRPTTRGHVLRAALARRRPGAARQQAVGRAGHGPGVLDPDKRYPAEYFVPADKGSIALDLDHLELDVEAFLVEAAAAARLARSGDAATARSKLEAAEALYGGDFLEEDPYEDWAVVAARGGPGDLHLDRPIARRGRRRGRRRRRRDPLLPPDPRARPVRRGRPPGARRRARRGRRHGEARRRYGFYAAKMEEISVEAAPFPGSTGSRAGARASSPGSFAAAPG